MTGSKADMGLVSKNRKKVISRFVALKDILKRVAAVGLGYKKKLLYVLQMSLRHCGHVGGRKDFLELMPKLL